MANEMNEEQRQAYDKALAKIEEAARESSESLDLGEMELTALPPEIGKLAKLQMLRLFSNQLTALPPEIGKLTNLEKLDLAVNQLTTLAPEIGKLTNLEILDLGENQLTTLAPEIGNLTNLGELYLFDNNLTSLPAEIGQLKNLGKLWLQNNNLTSLPPEIGQLKKLTELYFHGNDELGIPPEVLGVRANTKGKKARPGDIVDYYFRQRKEEMRELREAKVLMVGQGGVGKTSLVKRLIDDYYDPAEVMTDGINIRDWEIKGRPKKDGKEEGIRLKVWDFGGQEIMHATHQFFLTKRSLYVLVLDVRKGENESNIQYWLKIIQSYGGNSPVLVVTNQCDQGYLELNENRLMKDYAPNIKGFFSTSCKSGKGIEQLRAAIEKEINELEHVYDVLPKSYFDIKQKLEQLAESMNFIDTDYYRNLCLKHKISKEKEQNLLLRFLHDLGSVLHFDDQDYTYHLHNTIILNTEWVTEGVYKIINNNELMNKGGVLELEMIGGILNDPERYPTEQHKFIVDMMRKFELCFDFPDGHGKRVLIPELLGGNEPELDWDYDKSLNFEYHYSVLPSVIIYRFIVRMHHNLTKKRTYWRSGVVLAIDKNKALVRADADQGRMFISVSGPVWGGRRDALTLIRKEFKAIHGTIPRLGVKAKVPLPDDKGVVVDYEHLVKLEEVGQSEYWPDGAKRAYNVKELLDGVGERNPAVSATDEGGVDVGVHAQTIGGDPTIRVDSVGGEDRLGRKRLVEALAGVFLQSKIEDGVTVALMGDWGQGKSMVMDLLEKKLRNNKSQRFKFATYNAWKYENTNNVPAGIAQEVVKGLIEKIGEWEKYGLRIKFALKEYKEKLRGILFSVLLISIIFFILLSFALLFKNVPSWYKFITMFFGGGIIGIPFVLNFKELKKIFEHPMSVQLTTYLKLPDYGEHLGLLPVLKRHIYTLCSLRLGEDGKLVVFVDDLDRCQSDHIAKVLDAVRLVMKIPNVIVMIGIDHRIAFKAVEKHYRLLAEKDDGNRRSSAEIARDYLGKIVQLPIRLMPATHEELEDYVKEKLFADAIELPDEDLEDVVDDIVPPETVPDTVVIDPPEDIEIEEDEPPADTDTTEEAEEPEVIEDDEIVESETDSKEEPEIIEDTTEERDEFYRLAGLFEFNNPRQLLRLHNSFRFLKALGRDGEKDTLDVLKMLFWQEFLHNWPMKVRGRCMAVVAADDDKDGKEKLGKIESAEARRRLGKVWDMVKGLFKSKDYKGLAEFVRVVVLPHNEEGVLDTRKDIEEWVKKEDEEAARKKEDQKFRRRFGEVIDSLGKE